ncbi:hypothetical protein FHS17_002652 [Paenibacillus lupini]|nr:hypothetical protein [Paenibacillus lupini]
MPMWITWLTDHWLTVLLLAGIFVAVLYIILDRSLLFYKE